MKPASIPRRPVKSDNLKSIGYDPSSLQLTVQFHDGQLYAYQGVLPPVHSELMASPSKGRFLHKYLKGRYLALPVPKVT
jgi:hypothetical protein